MADRPFSSKILFDTPEQKAELESRNGLLQFDEVLKLIREATGKVALTPAILLRLQEVAIQDLYVCAGTFRQGEVYIRNSPHTPPTYREVPTYVQEMCDYVNDCQGKTPVHVAAYLMWRVNWIHPFMGGNGRTSRAVAYYILCTMLGFELPGKDTVPQQIQADRKPYYLALREADIAWEQKRLDLTAMENMLSAMLAKQLLAIHHLATGCTSPRAEPSLPASKDDPSSQPS